MDGIRGSYKLERKIETGGSATVWEASHLRTGRRVALKALHPHLVDNEVARSRFTSEADLMLGLDHANIVEAFEYTEDEHGPFLVMELLEGRNLQRLIESHGRFDPTEASRIARAAAAGLAYAHSRGVVHRDIKPANIVIDADRVVIVDFGIAASPNLDDRITTENKVVGTLPYMAPERALGEPGDESTDVYALGMVLYEMLTGSVPYKGKTPVEIVIQQRGVAPAPPSSLSDVPKQLDAIVLRCLRGHARQRFHTAGELLDQLDAYAAASGNSSTVTMNRVEMPGPKRRHPKPDHRRSGRPRRRRRRDLPVSVAAASVGTTLGSLLIGR